MGSGSGGLGECRCPVPLHPQASFQRHRWAEWDDLTFQFGPRAFLYADENQIVGFASTPVEAERLVTQFSKTYSKPPTPSGGDFYLIEQGRNDIRCQTVTLPPDTLLSPEALSLHYGSGSGEWHQDFIEKLRETNSRPLDL